MWKMFLVFGVLTLAACGDDTRNYWLPSDDRGMCVSHLTIGGKATYLTFNPGQIEFDEAQAACAKGPRDAFENCMNDKGWRKPATCAP